LYDEIEAEVNLAFDQLVFKISEAIYAHFKQQASAYCGILPSSSFFASDHTFLSSCSILIDKPYKALVEVINSGGKFSVPKSRYDSLLKQRHFQLLGRSINLNYLIGQRMNQHLRQNIDYAISRFEVNASEERKSE
jgi:cytoplasmic FMR1 interacting protein